MMQVASLIQKPSLSVREVQCSSVLHKMNYGSKSEYTVNFYRGCTHGCAYCYAPSLIHDERRWGSFVDAKINAPQVLRRELSKLPEKRVVFLSSASDPYQPVEARFKITRRCLAALLEYDFPIVILTRSPLVLRDLDLLRRFSWVRVGCSISSVSTRFYEPGVVSVSRRIETLRKLRENGITTWVSMAPMIPKLVLEDVDYVLKKLKVARVSCVVFGMLRFVGYEESRIMFEERTNKSSASVMMGEREVRERVGKLVAGHGLSDSESVLEWKGEPLATLDDY
jgi:DNA repair photolyase